MITLYYLTLLYELSTDLANLSQSATLALFQTNY